MIGQIRYINNLGSKQIRGEERESLAKQCILDSNGSANAFVNEIISSHVLAGECVLDDLNLKSKRFKDVVRKCVSEYMNQDMVSSNWIANVLDVTDTTKITINANTIKGFVQSFQVS